MPRIKLPNGQTASFPESMSLQEIQSAIESDPNSGALPGVPKAPVPAGLQGPPTTPPTHSAWSGIKLGSMGDTVGNVGTHLANMVTGPFKAAFAPPADPTELGVSAGGALPGSGPAALGIYRAFVKPSVDSVSEAMKLRQAGGPQASLWAPSRYNEAGQNVPTFGSKLLDAVPIYGPWARSAENETQTQGILPATAGVATDVVGSKVLGKVGGLAMRGAGKGLQAASATTPALETLGSRILLRGNPGELLQSALKPAQKYGAGVGAKLEAALPDVLAADPTAQGVGGIARAADTARDTAFQPYNNLLKPYQPLRPGEFGPVNKTTIQGTPIAEAQMASIPEIDRFEAPAARPSAPPPPVKPSGWVTENPMRGGVPEPLKPPSMPSPTEPTGIIASTARKAAPYRTDLPVSKVDVLREGANQKLHAFYQKAQGDQYAALANPETARIESIGTAARKQLYPVLEENAGLQPGTVEGMQQKYGGVKEFSDIANKREPVFERHDPVSLSQQIAFSHGGPIAKAFNIATQRLFGTLTDSDAQVNTAISRYQNPNTIPLPARAGLFPQMGSGLGGTLYGAGQMAGRMPLKYNPFAMYAASNPPRR